MTAYDRLTLTELWTRTLQELDTLHNAVERNDASLSATDLTDIVANIAALRKEGPFSASAGYYIGRIEEALDILLLQETLGERDIFDGVNDPDFGAIGNVKTVPILSKTGTCINQIRLHFEKILFMTDLLSARMDAEVQMARLKTA